MSPEKLTDSKAADGGEERSYVLLGRGETAEPSCWDRKAQARGVGGEQGTPQSNRIPVQVSLACLAHGLSFWSNGAMDSLTKFK